METSAETIDEAVRAIVDAVHPLRIILFGSAVRGEIHEHSDLDFLVVMPKDTHRRRTAQAIYRQIIGLSCPVDIVVATEEDLVTYGDTLGLVFYPALHEGKTVYAA